MRTILLQKTSCYTVDGLDHVADATDEFRKQGFGRPKDGTIRYIEYQLDSFSVPSGIYYINSYANTNNTVEEAARKAWSRRKPDKVRAD